MDKEILNLFEQILGIMKNTDVQMGICGLIDNTCDAIYSINLEDCITKSSKYRLGMIKKEYASRLVLAKAIELKVFNEDEEFYIYPHRKTSPRKSIEQHANYTKLWYKNRIKVVESIINDLKNK